ncbi:MAG: TolC family protein, partial [Lentisphaerota bacterium]
LTQPLYTGGRIASQRRGALDQKQAVAMTLQGMESDVNLQALNAYWNWSKAQSSVKAFESSVSWMEAHAQDMKHLREAGLATENDALATEVQLEQTRLRLVDSRHRVSLARAQIAYLAGKELAAEAMPAEAPVPVSPQGQDERQALAMAFSNRPERLARQLEARSADAATTAQKAGFYPQLYAQARYEQARPNNLNIPPADEWQGDAYVGVSVAWNLLDWGLTRAKVAEAATRSAQARLRADQADESITLEVRQARINLDSALTRVQVAQSAIRSAELNLNSASDLWKNGMSRHADVLDAQAKLTEAQFEHIAAKADAALALAALKHAVGVMKLSP